MKRFLPPILACCLTSFLAGQTLSGVTICIDPGHGGRNPANDRLVVPDPGVEFWESESNFQKALLLEALLEAKGATVLLTRTTNDYPNDADEPSLTARWQFANANDADWFHSIHSNAFNGVANYTLLLVRESTTNAGTAQSAEALSMSQMISPRIQNHLRTTANYTRLDYTFLGFRLGVLSGLAMPGELSEGSFHDVLPETRRLMNNSYRKMEAHAITNGFLQYFGVAQDATGIIAGIQVNRETGKPINFTKVRLLPEDVVYDGDGFNNGFYMFDGVTTGSHTVQFETPGYDLDNVAVNVVAEGIHFADRSLSSNLPPRLVSNTPVHNATGVSENPTIFLTFSRIIDRTSGETNIYLLDPGSLRLNGTYSWSNGDRTVSFIPSAALLYDTTYRMVIGGSVLDTSGRAFDGNGDGTGGDSVIISFRTRPFDMTPPAIATTFPPANAVLIAQAPVLNVTFNEYVNPATITGANFELSEVGGPVLTKTLQPWDVGAKTGINIYPSQSLTAGRTYRVVIRNISDQWDNTLSGPVSWEFVLTDQPFQFETIDGFNAGSPLWKQPALDTFSVGLVRDSTNLLRNTNPAYLVATLPSNSSSFRLRYGWEVNNPPWLISSTASDFAKFVQWTPAGKRLQLYMHGDGSGNLFRFAVEDSVDVYPEGNTENREVSRWIPIDWVGWKIVEWDFEDDSTGTWLGNGRLEGALRIFAFQLRHVPGSTPFGALYFDELQLVQPGTTLVERVPATLPPAFALHQNFPNPFNPETSISYDLPEQSFATLEVLDMLGRPIRTLVASLQTPGRYFIRWNGANEAGMPAASGVYYSRLRAGGALLTRKMVLVR